MSCCQASDNIEDPGKHLFPLVQKIDNDFYVGRIKDKNLWLVMERIDNRACSKVKCNTVECLLKRQTPNGVANESIRTITIRGKG